MQKKDKIRVRNNFQNVHFVFFGHFSGEFLNRLYKKSKFPGDF